MVRYYTHQIAWVSSVCVGIIDCFYSNIGLSYLFLTKAGTIIMPVPAQVGGFFSRASIVDMLLGTMDTSGGGLGLALYQQCHLVLRPCAPTRSLRAVNSVPFVLESVDNYIMQYNTRS